MAAGMRGQVSIWGIIHRKPERARKARTSRLPGVAGCRSNSKKTGIASCLVDSPLVPDVPIEFRPSIISDVHFWRGQAPDQVGDVGDRTKGVLDPRPWDRINRGKKFLEIIIHCLILGFATEYSTSVRKFTAT